MVCGVDEWCCGEDYQQVEITCRVSRDVSEEGTSDTARKTCTYTVLESAAVLLRTSYLDIKLTSYQFSAAYTFRSSHEDKKQVSFSKIDMSLLPPSSVHLHTSR
jgi:hypothetical protein